MDGAAITITIMTLAAANTLGMDVGACSRPAVRHVRAGRVRRFRRRGRLAAAHPYGMLAVRHLQ